MAVQRFTGRWEAPPNAEQMAQELELLQRDMKYLETVRKQLMAEHPGAWIAILDQQVIAVEEDVERLGDALREAAIPRTRLVIDHLLPDTIWVLSLS